MPTTRPGTATTTISRSPKATIRMRPGGEDASQDPPKNNDDPASPPANGNATPPKENNDPAPSNDDGGTNGTSDAKLDTTYITDDFFAALIVHPSKALQSKLAAKATKRPEAGALPPPIEQGLANLEKVKQVEQVTVLLGPGPGGRMPGVPISMPKISTAVIVRFHSPELMQELLASGPQLGNEERTHNGKKYHMQAFSGGISSDSFEVPTAEADAKLAELKKENERRAADPNLTITYNRTDDPESKTTAIEVVYAHTIDEPMMPNARYLPDNKTMIVAREPLLKKMMDAKQAKSPLLDRLAAIEGKHDLMAVALGEPLREPVKQLAGHDVSSRV